MASNIVDLDKSMEDTTNQIGRLQEDLAELKEKLTFEDADSEEDTVSPTNKHSRSATIKKRNKKRASR